MFLHLGVVWYRMILPATVCGKDGIAVQCWIEAPQGPWHMIFVKICMLSLLQNALKCYKLNLMQTLKMQTPEAQS